MATVYLPSCPDLPTHRPYGFPHIVEGGDELHYALEQGLRLHVADGAATVLFNHSPETLKALLDIRCDSFSFVRYSGPNERIADLYIERHVDVVTVCIINLGWLSVRIFITNQDTVWVLLFPL